MKINLNEQAGKDGLSFLIEATKPENLERDPYWTAQEEILGGIF